jgi:cysteinyl-tRNA synthetase
LTDFLATIDDTLGLQLVVSTPDIDEDTKRLVLERQQAREQKDWQRADELRDALAQQGIVVKDTAHGPIWQYAG